jgi:adenylate cyclase
MPFRKPRPEVAPGIVQMHPRWERILRGESSLARLQRLYRGMFALIPSPWRCKFCNAPFSGPSSGALKWIGYSPSAKNPNVCAR